MIISTLSPESLVEDPAYVAMIANANPHWSTLSRSTLSRATSTRFRELQGDTRATLSGVTICHVNTDMWTSLANEPFGSFLVSYIDQAWVLRSRVLCCGVVNGRHAASAIATFLLRVAGEFGISDKVGIVRTDGASNCMGAGRVLGEAARGADHPSGFETGRARFVAPTGDACGVGRADVVGGAEHAEAGGAAGQADRPGGAAGAAIESDEEEGGDGADLEDVGSDGGDFVSPTDAASGGTTYTSEEEEARANVFCAEIPGAFHDGREPAGGRGGAAFSWQHARCATHTLQFSVRAGLAVPCLRGILKNVRLVSKLCRTSTNFKEELRLSVEREEARMATAEGRGIVRESDLVSRLMIDCPTRWGSTLTMLRRFVRVGPAVPPALSSYYFYTSVQGSKKRVECPNMVEQAALLAVISFLSVLEGASTSLGFEVKPTSFLEETVFWYVKKVGAPQVGDCVEVAALKRVVLENMRVRRERERLTGTNPEWFPIRLAAVLLNPRTKAFDFGKNAAAVSVARNSVLDIIKWMAARADLADEGTMPAAANDGINASNKCRRSFVGNLLS